jgi:LCP family protein required for cell wall assembly
MTTGPMAPHHRRAIATVIATTLVALALATGSLVAVFYKHLDANLKTGQAIKHLAKKKHTGPKDPLNILVMGIDTRSGAGNKIDNETGEGGSDTNILLHVSADRKTAYGVSIPRDTLVDRPTCTTTSGKTIPGGTAQMWNKAYALGGPACTARQLEAVSGIEIDGYLTVDFEGFKSMVDAIDGVQVCIPKPVNDQAHGIVFKAGTQTLKGQQALNYVRERYSTPNADIGRMKRQQAFISSMINKVVSAGTLTRPDRLIKFASAAADSLTASPGFDTVHDLTKLAGQLKHIDLTHIRFVTVPSQPYDVPRSDPRWGRVELLPGAKNLWKRIIDDKPLSKSLISGSISAGAPPSSTSPSGTSSNTTSPSSPTGSTSPSGQPSDTQAAQEAAANGLCA